MTERLCCSDCGAEFIYCDGCEKQLAEDEVAESDGREHLCAACLLEIKAGKSS